MGRLAAQMRFVAEAGLLKGVERRTRLSGLDRRENSAEHSWHLAVMALALADYAADGADPLRVLRMVLIHDMVEIDAGDLFLYSSPELQAEQDAAERIAADRIFALLPPDQAAEMRGLWDEFNDRVTPDARFARALDRLQPMLENLAAGGGTWVEHGVTADQVLARVELIRDGSPVLGDLAAELVAGAVELGLLAPAPGPEIGPPDGT